MTIVGLKGEGVRIVPIDRTLHLENALRWMNDPEVTASLEFNLGITRRQEEAFFDRAGAPIDTDFHWAILDDREAHVGFIGLHAIHCRHRSAKGGIGLGGRSAWGRGLATAAIRVRTRFAFETLGLDRVEGQTVNPAMRRVYEKPATRAKGRSAGPSGGMAAGPTRRCTRSSTAITSRRGPRSPRRSGRRTPDRDSLRGRG